MSWYGKIWKKIKGEGKKIVIRVERHEYERLIKLAEKAGEKLEEYILRLLK